VKTFAAVYFDCDSTLSAIEGVDELLAFAPPSLRADVLDLTTRAMEGTLPLAQVYETRLRLLSPRREQLDRIGELYVARIVPDAAALVEALQFLGKEVGIVSGGLLVPVQRVAQHLGIPLANVHAVPLVFDARGDYIDFDRSSPLWRNRGKIEVLQRLPAAQRPVAFVGDGATDLETQGTADLFIGYGGVAARPVVRDRAQVFVGTPSLAPVLLHVATPQEVQQLARHPRFAPLLSAAKA
jgi:phosphoserine phosphatase